MNKFTFHYVYNVYWVTIHIYIYISSLKWWCVVWWMYVKTKFISIFISKLREFSKKKLNFSRYLEWWYRSDEAGHYSFHDLHWSPVTLAISKFQNDVSLMWTPKHPLAPFLIWMGIWPIILILILETYTKIAFDLIYRT